MLRIAQLCYTKHNIQTFHINDISNNNEAITLLSSKNNKQEKVEKKSPQIVSLESKSTAAIAVMILVSKIIYLLVFPRRIIWYLNINRISCHAPDYIWTTNY